MKMTDGHKTITITMQEWNGSMSRSAHLIRPQDGLSTRQRLRRRHKPPLSL